MEYRQPHPLALSPANYDFWTRRDVWTAAQFGLLMLEKEPLSGPMPSPSAWFRNIQEYDYTSDEDKQQYSGQQREYENTLELIRDAKTASGKRGGLYVAESPGVMAGLEDSRFFVSDLMPWAKRKRFDIPAPLLVLLEDEAEAEPPKQWGFDHDTELLQIARKVIAEYWEGKDPKGAPDKDSLVAELRDKHGLSKNEAEAVDILTRHDSRRNKARKSVG